MSEDCNVKPCVMYNELGNEKCNGFKPEEVDKCRMYKAWNARAVGLTKQQYDEIVKESKYGRMGLCENLERFLIKEQNEVRAEGENFYIPMEEIRKAVTKGCMPCFETRELHIESIVDEVFKLIQDKPDPKQEKCKWCDASKKAKELLTGGPFNMNPNINYCQSCGRKIDE